MTKAKIRHYNMSIETFKTLVQSFHKFTRYLGGAVRSNLCSKALY